MIKELIHIATSKSVFQEILNWWLSYTVAQPVNFDLTILFYFTLQYIGFVQIRQLILQSKAFTNKFIAIEHPEIQTAFAEPSGLVNNQA